MNQLNHTLIKDFTFIVKQPYDSKCAVIVKDIMLLHKSETYAFDYESVISEFTGCLWASSSDPDFNKLMELYSGPIKFECIAIETPDINQYEFSWLSHEITEELKKQFPEDEIYGVLFL